MQKDAINAVVAANNEAVGRGDIKAALATFEEGGALVAQPGMVSQGMAALTEAFSQFIAMKPGITVTGEETVVADDIALHTSTWQMVMTTPDGSRIEQDGFSVVVLRRQSDGRWLMVIDNPFGDLLLKKQMAAD